jgi:hypothetical protein
LEDIDMDNQDMQILDMLKTMALGNARAIAESIYDDGDEELYSELTLAIDVLENGVIGEGAKVDYIALWKFVIEQISMGE